MSLIYSCFISLYAIYPEESCVKDNFITDWFMHTFILRTNLGINEENNEILTDEGEKKKNICSGWNLFVTLIKMVLLTNCREG